MEALQQRVVEITCDTRSLADAFFQAHVELPGHLPQPQLIQRPQQCHKSCQAQRAEPIGLVPGRRNYKVQSRAFFVPHAAVVAGKDAKFVMLRRQVRVFNVANVCQLSPVDRRLRVRVRDDGKGIDPKLLSDDRREGHFGLPGMRERAKLIGGKLTVWSELDSGTEVELRIPASRAYTAADGQRSWLAEKFAKLSGKDTELRHD